MFKLPRLRSPGCVLIWATFLLGSIGLLLTAGSIYGLATSDGRASTNLPSLGGGIALLVIAFLTFRGATDTDTPQSLFSSEINPIERARQAKSEKERELAARDAGEAFTRANKLTPEDHEFVDGIKANILAAPTPDEILKLLGGKGDAEVALANPMLQPIAFALRPTDPVNYAKGLVLEALIWAGLIISIPFLFISGAYVFDIWSSGKAVLYKTMRWRRRARQYRVRPNTVLQHDCRPPILYLRSFSEDYEEDLESYWPTTTEEKLASYYNCYGPVISIGRPNEDLPLLGASRLYFDDSTWQAGVLYLMSISQLVIIQAGFATWLLWELGVACQRIEPERLSISFATWGVLDEWKRHLHYIRFKAYAEELSGWDLPPDIKRTNCVSFKTRLKSELYESQPIIAQQPELKLPPVKWSSGKRLLMGMIVALVLSLIVASNKWRSTNVESVRSLSSTAADFNIEQAAPDSARHLLEARKALADGYRPNRDLLKATWGRLDEAETHLEQVHRTDKEFLEAQVLLNEVRRRKAAKQKASEVMDREGIAAMLQSSFAEMGYPLQVSVSGPEMKTLKVNAPNFGIDIVKQEEIRRLKEAGFIKLIFSTKFGYWSYDLTQNNNVLRRH